MKNEREEFTLLLQDAVFAMTTHDILRKSLPKDLDYQYGEEKKVLGHVKKLLSQLQETQTAQARELILAMERRREDLLSKCQSLLDVHQYDPAKRVFDSLIKEYPEDILLKADIGERFLNAGRYEEAYEYLAQALEENPESIHLYNRVGMALRKLGRFDTAEKYYLKALEYAPEDPNLHFNLGRLYIDWRKWGKVMEAAEQALKYRPDFAEAAKMYAFGKKQLEKLQSTSF